MTIEDFLSKWHFADTQFGKTWVKDFVLRTDEVTMRTGCTRNNSLGGVGYKAECTVDVPRAGDVRALAERNGRNDTVENPISKVLDKLHERLLKNVAYAHRLSLGNPGFGKPILAVLLGAGFSQAFGFPSTTEFKQDSLIPCAKPEPTNRSSLKEGLEEYPLSEFAKDESQIPDIEYLLTLWTGYLDQCISADEDSQTRKRPQYEAFIENIACHLFRYGNEFDTDAERAERFAELSQWLRQAQKKFDVRFLTFNYDTMIERLIQNIGQKYVYLDRSREEEQVIPIRKLHGSIHWLDFENEVRRQDGTPLALLFEDTNQYICAAPELHDAAYIASGELPVIVPPSANKKYKGLIDYVWRFARGDLEQVERVLIVGYSFPPLDAYATITLQGLMAKNKKLLRYVNSNPCDCKRVSELLNLRTEQVIQKPWSVAHFHAILK